MHKHLFQIIFVPILFKEGRCDSFTQKERRNWKLQTKLVIFQYSQSIWKDHVCTNAKFFNSFLSKQQCALRKGYSTKQCLLALFIKWNEPFIVVKCLVLYSKNFLRNLIVLITNYRFQNLTHTDSAYQL